MDYILKIVYVFLRLVINLMEVEERLDKRTQVDTSVIKEKLIIDDYMNFGFPFSFSLEWFINFHSIIFSQKSSWKKLAWVNRIESFWTLPKKMSCQWNLNITPKKHAVQIQFRINPSHGLNHCWATDKLLG